MTKKRERKADKAAQINTVKRNETEPNARSQDIN